MEPLSRPQAIIDFCLAPLNLEPGAEAEQEVRRRLEHVIKTFQAEFDKPKLKFGVLGNKPLSAEEVRVIADLPPLPEIQGKILGLLQAPAQKLVALINTPGTQLARVIGAYAEKSV